MEETKNYLSLSTDHAATLLKTQRWTNFLAILGFIYCGIVFMGGIMYGVGAVLTELLPGVIAAIASILYVIIAAVGVYIYFHLKRASDALKTALTTGENEKLDEAVKHQYTFWKAQGILSIVSIVFLLLVIIACIIVISMIPGKLG